MSSIDQQFIEYIVKSLVSKPDAVKIDRRIDEKGVLLELTVDQEDLGRVIGKRGATAQSLRTLLRALGTKNDARYNLKIVDLGSPPPNSHSSSSQSDDGVAADEPAEEPQAEEAAAEEKPEPEPVAEEEKADDIAEENHSSVISRTRKELAELDDLDV